MKRLHFFIRLFISLSAPLLLSGCFNQPVYRQSQEPLRSVATVDLQRYLGKWYEIYRLPNRFEGDDCLTVTADYGLLQNNQISVLNTCIRADKLQQAHGKAKIVEGSGNAQLKVTFFWPFYGDYWVVDVASDYSWSIVSEPAGRYLWVLARNKTIPKELEDQLLKKVESLGYKRSDLIKPENSR